MTQFKSDARPSDTKSVVLHKENDARLLAHLKTLKRESAFWRTAAYFYLDFMAWLGTLPPVADVPEPERLFIYYQSWLESHLPPSPGRGGVGGEVESHAESLDPESIAAALLPGVRSIIEAALAGLPPSPARGGAGGEVEILELTDLFSTELILE